MAIMGKNSKNYFNTKSKPDDRIYLRTALRAVLVMSLVLVGFYLIVSLPTALTTSILYLLPGLNIAHPYRSSGYSNNVVYDPVHAEHHPVSVTQINGRGNSIDTFVCIVNIIMNI
ncbi:MAG: hypothetical protein ACTHKP_12785 [Nitrososphaeraceae archaeon]